MLPDKEQSCVTVLTCPLAQTPVVLVMQWQLRKLLLSRVASLTDHNIQDTTAEFQKQILIGGPQNIGVL